MRCTPSAAAVMILAVSLALVFGCSSTNKAAPTSSTSTTSTVVTAATSAFQTFFDGRSTVDQKVASIDHGEQLRAMLTDAAKDPQFAALSTMVRSVKPLDAGACAAAGVSSPCAEVHHDLLVGQTPAAVDKTSYAVQVSGKWVVATSSWCAFVALGGASCPTF